jgi:hypothetical protein
MISGYFAGLFSMEVDEPDTALLENVVPHVTPEMNEALLRPYIEPKMSNVLCSL